MFRDVILLPVQTFSKVCSAQKHLVWINSEHIKEKGAFFFSCQKGAGRRKMPLQVTDKWGQDLLEMALVMSPGMHRMLVA